MYAFLLGWPGPPTRSIAQARKKVLGNSITEVEQIVRRGKYTAYVPTAGITMVDALLQREDGRKP